jgi:sugar/nucleoside kinase (ribokinase family)
MICEPSRSATLRAVECARKSGLLISFDPNLRPSLWGSLDDAKRIMIECLGRADMVKVNETEVEFITGAKDMKEGSDRILEYGPKLVLMTRGAESSAFNNGKCHGEVGAFKVKMADPVGCGDAFVAGAMVGLISKVKDRSDLAGLDYDDLVEIVRFANAAGALTATKVGVIPALPTREEVTEFLPEENRLHDATG